MKTKTKDILFMAVSSAIISIVSPFSITFGSIPLTLSLLVIAIIGIIFKPYQAIIIVGLYILIGAIGVPVFSNFSGGISVLFGITGGYIIGYLPFVLIISLTASKFKSIWVIIGSSLIALILCYLLGSIWFMFQTHNTLTQTIILTILPFIIPDIIKIIIATLIGMNIKPRIFKIENEL